VCIVQSLSTFTACCAAYMYEVGRDSTLSTYEVRLDFTLKFNRKGYTKPSPHIYIYIYIYM